MVWGPKENITLGSGCVPWYLETILKIVCSQCYDPHWICRDPLGSSREACGCDNASNLALLTGAEAQCRVKLLLFSLVSEDTQVQTYSQPNTHWNQNQSLKPLMGKRLTGGLKLGIPPHPPKNDHEILEIARSHFIINLFWTACVTEKIDYIISVFTKIRAAIY